MPDTFNLRDWIGKPYAANGRGPQQYDCWGLVLAIAKAAGLDYPEFIIDARDCRAVAGAMQRACADSAAWLRLNEPEPWCVVLLSTTEIGDHTGIAVPSALSVSSVPSVSSVLPRRPTHFLQTTLRTGSIISAFNDRRFSHRIKGLYRWIGQP